MLQTVLFPRSKFSYPTAITWLKNHNLKNNKVDVTPKYLRFRQFPPKRYAQYYTITLKNGIEMVFLR